MDGFDAEEISVCSDDVELVVGRVDAFDDVLTPAESQRLHGARRADFTSGRRVARYALERAGFEPRIDRIERRPVWPDGAVGSITHAAGIAIAAVASTTRYRGIGIDLEAVDAVSEKVATRIAASHETPDRPGGGALVFSAKEAIYKAVNPLVGEYLPFRAVEIQWDMASLSFTARTVVDRPSSADIAMGEGRFQPFMDCWLTVFGITR